MRFAAWLIAACAAALPAAGQRDWSKVEIGTTRITDSLYMLTGSGGNIGLSIGADAVFLVDDQYAPLTEKIQAAIAKLTPRPVGFVLNTHWHGDHSGGNENLGKAGAIIIAHENVRKRMSAEQFNEVFKTRTPASAPGALPIVTFSGGTVTFHINGDEVRAIHVPNAHTDGDTIVHFVKSDAIHAGDVVWIGYYPFIDVSSGGTIDGTIAACDRILAQSSERTRIIPGHGPLVGAAEVRAYRDMLATIAGRVRKLAAAGRSREQIIAAAEVTAEFDEAWGKRFLTGERFRELVVADLLRAGAK
jgi:glyoxylase-like metal-dependent hydrolase (beta-lactamase superfamily II)